MAGDNTRVGMIGCGYICARHSENLSQIPQVEIIAYCDIVREKAVQLARDFGGTVYTDFEAMLKHEHPDAIFVCTPPTLRAEIIEISATYGIHAFIEKPLALSLKEAQTIVDLVEKSGIHAQVGYAYRFHEVSKLNKLLVDSGTLGEIHLMSGAWWGGVLPAAWQRQRASTMGQVVEQVSHIYDLARFLLGDIQSICSAMRYSPNRQDSTWDTEDASAALLKFASGALGSVTHTCHSSFIDTNFVEIKIAGSRGVSILRPRLADLTIYEKTADTQFAVYEEPSSVTRKMAHPKNTGYYNEVLAFIASVRDDCPCSVQPREAARTLAVVLAVLSAHEQSTWIEIIYPQ